MNRSSFSYTINKDLNTLSIIDLKKGKSVTNDIENVLNDIVENEGFSTISLLDTIVYRDSYDEWTQVFPKWNSYGECVDVIFKPFNN